MKNMKKMLIVSLLLPMMVTSISQIMAPDDLIYFQDFDGSSGVWTPMNPYNDTWDFLDGRLNGNGMINHWDDIVLDDMMFNISEYTVIFDVNLLSGIGEEQFHFIFNFYSGYAVMELGSTSGYSHYIDQYGGWFDFDYQFPMDKWVTVHMIVELGQLELWVNGQMIFSNMTMNTPLLENIGFGLYSYTSAQFDNIHVYTGYHRPEPPIDDEKPDDKIYPEDFWVTTQDAFVYQLKAYVGGTSEVDLTNWFYDKDAGENLPVSLAQGDQLKLIIFDFADWGVEIEVHKNGDYIGNGLNNFIFLPIYGNLSNFKMFDGIPLVEDIDYYRITMTYYDNSTSEDAILEFLWNKQTGVLEKLELVSGIFSPDGSEISKLLFELVDSATDNTQDDNTIPSLTPGWEFISILYIVILIPILSRRKRA